MCRDFWIVYVELTSKFLGTFTMYAECEYVDTVLFWINAIKIIAIQYCIFNCYTSIMLVTMMSESIVIRK